MLLLLLLLFLLLVLQLFQRVPAAAPTCTTLVGSCLAGRLQMRATKSADPQLGQPSNWCLIDQLFGLHKSPLTYPHRHRHTHTDTQTWLHMCKACVRARMSVCANAEIAHIKAAYKYIDAHQSNWFMPTNHSWAISQSDYLSTSRADCDCDWAGIAHGPA